jgi:hypothetical protein
MSKWSRHVRGAALSAGSAAFLFFLLTALPAFAAGRHSGGKRESQEKAARKACLTGDYNGGIAILADLFIEEGDPIYVFNQGRCLEQNSRYKDAIARFEEFLRVGETAKLDTRDRAAAKSHIEECKVKLADEEKALALTPQPLPQPLPQPMPPPAAGPDATTETTLRPKVEPEPTKDGKGLLIGGIVIGGMGVAATVAGIVFNLKANSMADEMENTVDAYRDSKSSSQKTYGTLAWVGYGVGAACIATGTVLIAIGASRGGSSKDTGVALVPAVGPGQAGVLLRGGF